MLCTETASSLQVEKYKVVNPQTCQQYFCLVMQKHLERKKKKKHLSPYCPTKIIGSKIDFKVSRVMHLSFSLFLYIILLHFFFFYSPECAKSQYHWWLKMRPMLWAAERENENSKKHLPALFTLQSLRQSARISHKYANCCMLSPQFVNL